MAAVQTIDNITIYDHSIINSSDDSNKPLTLDTHTKCIIDSNPKLALQTTMKMMYMKSGPQLTDHEKNKKVVNDLVKKMKQDPRFKRYTEKALKKIIRQQLSTLTHEMVDSKGNVKESIVEVPMAVIEDQGNNVVNIHI